MRREKIFVFHQLKDFFLQGRPFNYTVRLVVETHKVGHYLGLHSNKQFVGFLKELTEID
jgi:hypothetical protein